MKWTLIAFALLIALSCFGQMKFEGVKLEGVHTHYSPADISTLSNWWAPESPTIIDTTGTSTYRTWFDIKDAKNLEMDTKVSQPTQIFITNTVSGKVYPILRFDGVNDRMTNNAVAGMVTGNDIPASGFIIIRPFDAANTGIYTFGSSAPTGNTSNQFLHKPLQGGVNYRETRVDNAGGVVNATSSATVVSNGWNFLAFSFSGTRVTTSVNGAIQEIAFNSGQLDVDTFCLGALFRNGAFAQNNQSDVAELALFSGNIGTNALNSLYLYYAKPKYNLP